MPRAWAKWQELLSAELLALLLPLQIVLTSIETQLDLLTQRIEANARASSARQLLPKGIGELTQEVIANEVCDWNRFSNRREVASFTGLCPREHSSGGIRRQGNINKHGNPLLRKMLCEAVWRLLQYQPEWIRFQRMKETFKVASGARKKQLVTALARMLAIDLWRLNTGHTTLEALGFIPAAEIISKAKNTPKPSEETQVQQPTQAEQPPQAKQATQAQAKQSPSQATATNVVA